MLARSGPDPQHGLHPRTADPGRHPGGGRATEGDLVFAARPSAVATLVDRATRYAMIVARPDGYQADAVARMLIERMGQLPTHPRRSLTGDRGREMADHAVITAALSTPVFFCDPHHPWQRAQNTIGCLRPAALRKSASGLRGFLRRAKYSAPVGRSGFPVARAQGWHAWASRTGDRSRHPPQLRLCAVSPRYVNICPDILTFNHKKVSLRLLCGEPGGGDGAFDQSAEAFTGVFINDRRDRIGRPSSVTS